jgi:uncharacterized membrane protein YtjA (UPF0391 family)
VPTYPRRLTETAAATQSAAADRVGYTRKGALMLHYAVVFFIIALIAAFFGFGGVAAGAAGIAKILFIVFLIGAIVSFLMSLGRRV